MSGQTYYKNQFSNYLKRRSFLLRVGLITSGIFLNGCIKKIRSNNSNIKGTLKGPNEKAGHILRDKIKLNAPTVKRKIKTLIVGAGISGLSAARWLQKNGDSDFEILDLENHIGGNSFYGHNEISSYPLGAHYITIANNDDKLLIDFLKEINVITHFENELPYYNDFYLTFDPEERLLINGEWQEGLIPDFGVPEIDKKQIRHFLGEVEQLKNTKGNDGKFVFNIPISNCSNDEKFKQLDKISFDEYLEQKGYTSKYLIWYLNYACKDDYGQKIEKISAWAGLHYFASRRGIAANAEQNAILTWPEGNGWIMKKLAEGTKNQIKTNLMCYDVEFASDSNLLIKTYNTLTGNTELLEVENLILCSPQYVNNRLLKKINREINYSIFNYSPWLIANITITELPKSKGIGLCWDNVAYNMPSVGYVNSAQQHLKLTENKRIITYYLPLCDYDPSVSRLAAYSRSYEQWLDIVLPELEIIHPNITNSIEKIDFWIWGHGMIAPSPNFIFNDELKKSKSSINNKIFFAHSDLSGISIFEEAFHQGITAAQQVLDKNG